MKSDFAVLEKPELRNKAKSKVFAWWIQDANHAQKFLEGIKILTQM